MSFDLSRVRFDPRKDFHGVIMQQGRVQLDADWNEWVAQVGRRIQVGALDTLGAAAVPSETRNGFLIGVKGGKLTIDPGRIYVDGLLAENHGAAPDEWMQHLADECGTVSIRFLEQLYLPFNGTNIEDSPASAFNPPTWEDGKHLVYVDVWQREVTHLQDPNLVEQAVGVDSTGRLQTVWQVKVLEDGAENVTRETDDKDIPGWLDATRPSAGRLSTSVGEPPGEPEPCQVPPKAGYRGAENQLYRVEIHEGGPAGKASFKWSRDNATVATRVTHINENQLTVESVGRDDVLRFHDGDWVEITDDWYELHNLPGQMARIRVVDANANLITLESQLARDAFPVDGTGAVAVARHTRVRRWDQSGKVLKKDGTAYHDLNEANGDDAEGRGTIPVPTAGTELFLEGGILVEFTLEPASGEGGFKSGDYWVFAARTADPSLEILDEAPPRGIHHHYARLAVVTLPNGALDDDDLRTLWPPLQKGSTCGCCTLTVGQGGDYASIQEALDRLPEEGGRICLMPGEHVAARIKQKGNVSIVGCGLASVVRPVYDQFEGVPGAVFEILESQDVSLHNMYIAGQIWVESSSAIRICDNHIETGAAYTVGDNQLYTEKTIGAAVHVAANDVLLARNSVVVPFDQGSGNQGSGRYWSPGGIELAAGSASVRVVDNIIQGGSGNGITLGGEADDPESAQVSLRDITIEHNRITGMGGSGIGIPLPGTLNAERAAENADEFGEVVLRLDRLLAQSGSPVGGLAIVGNDIRDNFREPSVPNRGLGGITLGFCRDLRIRDNRIESNGTAHSVPACGVFLTYGEDVELTGNRIVNNGHTPEQEEPESSWDGGVVLSLVTSLPVLGPLTGGELAPPAALEARPAARIHDNVVDQPRGRALYVVAYGPITCTDNHLSSERAGVSLRDWVGSTVFILNAGGIDVPEVKKLIEEQLGREQVWGADGHTLFAHNQVTGLDSRSVSDGRDYSVLASQVLLSWDDVCYEGNQNTWMGPMGKLFCHVGLVAQTLRASGNRLRESGDDLVSLATVTPGWGNAATYNQADHCIVAITIDPPGVPDTAGNQQLRVKPENCQKHEGTIREFFTRVLGGLSGTFSAGVANG